MRTPGNWGGPGGSARVSSRSAAGGPGATPEATALPARRRRERRGWRGGTRRGGRRGAAGAGSDGESQGGCGRALPRLAPDLRGSGRRRVMRSPRGGERPREWPRAGGWQIAGRRPWPQGSARLARRSRPRPVGVRSNSDHHGSVEASARGAGRGSMTRRRGATLRRTHPQGPPAPVAEIDARIGNRQPWLKAIRPTRRAAGAVAWPASAILQATRSPAGRGPPGSRLEAGRPGRASVRSPGGLQADAGVGEAHAPRCDRARAPDDLHCEAPAATPPGPPLQVVERAALAMGRH